jgi:hypothetical protein
MIIAAVPPDAQITIDGESRGRGPVPVRLDFRRGQTHTVRVSRLGYNDSTLVLDGSERQDPLVVQLSPRTKLVRFVVGPLPGIVKIDGQPVSEGAASRASKDLPFTVDAANNWVPHVATAERPGFRPAEVTIRYTDSDRSTCWPCSPSGGRRGGDGPARGGGGGRRQQLRPEPGEGARLDHPDRPADERLGRPARTGG